MIVYAIPIDESPLVSLQRVGSKSSKTVLEENHAFHRKAKPS